MNRDDIYRMAREADLLYADLDELEDFAALVAAATRESMKTEGWRACAVGQRETQHCGLLETAVLAEREACALVCEVQDDDYVEPECAWSKCAACAAAIRARGNHFAGVNKMVEGSHD